MIEDGAQNAQLTDFFAVPVMIGIFKVLEPVQLREQLGGEQQPGQCNEMPALQCGQFVLGSGLVHADRVPDKICYIITISV